MPAGAGLEIKRRCGWVPGALQSEPHIVWARKHVSTDTCPKSTVTAQSIGWIEEFLVWKRLRLEFSRDLSARQVEAFLVLEEELKLEERHGPE